MGISRRMLAVQIYIAWVQGFDDPSLRAEKLWIEDMASFRHCPSPERLMILLAER